MKTILVDAVNTFMIKGEGIYRPMLDLLEKYPDRKIILTNADDKQMAEFGLTNMPYEVFTLKHKPDKTDPRYFAEMLKYFGLSKNDVVYFEHNIDAVKSAESVGITTYHYDSDRKDMEGLSAFLDQNL